jgi:TonB family protein
MAAPPQSSPSKKSSYRTPVIVVVLLLAAFAGYRFFFSSHGAGPSTAVSTQHESQPETNAATPSPAPPAKSPAATPNSAVPNAGASATKSAPQPKPAAKSEASSTGGNASGSVVHQALPDIPESALNTIHGTFHVVVRATSDASGNVSDVSLDSRGPSQYFANLALKASHDWKFSPNAPGDWLIRFEFTSDGVTASAAPAN